MKKIILMFALIMSMVVSANASTAIVDNGTIKDNWYVGIGVGTNVWNDVNSWTLFNANSTISDGKTNSWWRTQPLYGNVTIGKMINPYFGVEADYKMLFNLRGQSKFLDAHNLSGNVVFNLNNIINGYDGKRRFFEVELIGGAGWFHNFNSGVYHNALTVRGGLRGNFKVGKHLALTVTPEYVWFPKKFVDVDKAFQGVNISVGVKWLIPSNRGGFPMKELRDYTLEKELNDKINVLNETVNTQSKSIADLSETVKILSEKNAKDSTITSSIPSITFKKGSSVVDSSQIATVANILKATDGKVILVGNTSPEGTEVFNKKLASARAEAVKKALVNEGVDVSRITIANDYANQRSVTIGTK